MNNSGEIVLDVACGPSKVNPSYIGIDQTLFPGVDIQRDVLRGLPFHDNFADGIVCRHFLEHIDGEDLLFIINEFWRVSKPGASWQIVVPDHTSPNMAKDPLHKKKDWQELSFQFWEIGPDGNWKIFAGPAYGRKAKLHLAGTAINGNRDRSYGLKVIKP